MRHRLQRASDGLSGALFSRNIKSILPCGRRYIRISTIPSGTLDDLPAEAPNISNAVTPGTFPGLVKANTLIRVVDARFEVLGGPNSLLSVSLAASQNLYTRRGTLVGVGGKAENVSSSGPWLRAHSF